MRNIFNFSIQNAFIYIVWRYTWCAMMAGIHRCPMSCVILYSDSNYNGGAVWN